MRNHAYALEVRWTGNLGQGTSTLRGYSRDHEVSAVGVQTIVGSSDPAFRGDPSRWNPEQLLVASIAQCHMLWYLSLAAVAGVTVVAYGDSPTGMMIEDDDGGGQFSEVTLHPRVTISRGSDPAVAHALHERVGEYCFIARSVNFPVNHVVTVVTEDGTAS